MLDEYVIAASAGVIVAAVVILSGLLSRYSRLVKEASESTKLAKDVWDSVNSRFAVVDTRIIDLMVKLEVLASRSNVTLVPRSEVPRSEEMHSAPPQPAAPSNTVKIPSMQTDAAPPASLAEGTETEAKVLQLLAEGPKTSAQIKAEVGRSREHTARLMKVLFDRGLVTRNDRSKPYLYEITDSGKSYLDG
jgi:Sugar-specific transcriptional regulator TrmB